MNVAAKDLRVGDVLAEASGYPGFEVTSTPVESAWGPGFVSFSIWSSQGYAAICKYEGDRPVAIRRRRS